MNPKASSIARYIRWAREGRGDALDQLAQAYRNYLHLLATTCLDRELRGKADPSDVVQETLLKAHRNFHAFRGTTEGELVVWLRTILTRTLFDLQRRFLLGADRLVSRECSLENLVERSSCVIEGFLAAAGPSPSQGACARERSVLLADALAGLAPDDREVITLRNLQELGWNEIAGRMGKTPDGARMLWTRALRRLGDALAAGGADASG